MAALFLCVLPVVDTAAAAVDYQIEQLQENVYRFSAGLRMVNAVLP